MLTFESLNDDVNGCVISSDKELSVKYVRERETSSFGFRNDGTTTTSFITCINVSSIHHCMNYTPMLCTCSVYVNVKMSQRGPHAIHTYC